MNERLHPPTCSCYPLAIGTVRFYSGDEKLLVEHRIARTAVRRIVCEIHPPHKYLQRFVAR